MTGERAGRRVRHAVETGLRGKFLRDFSLKMKTI